jgi:hypothetical protein
MIGFTSTKPAGSCEAPRTVKWLGPWKLIGGVPFLEPTPMAKSERVADQAWGIFFDSRGVRSAVKLHCSI